MKKSAIKFMIAFMLLLALFLASAMTLVIVSGQNPFTGFSVAFGGKAELANRQTFAASSVDTLEVRYQSEGIELRRAPGDEIVLEEYMSRWEENMLATTTSSGGRLRIESGKRGWLNNWNAYVVLYLPENWDGALQVTSSSGSVRSEANWSLQSAQLTSTSGSVRFSDLAVVEDMLLQSSSGSVSAGNLAAGGDIQLKSTSGSVRVGDVTGTNIRMQSSSGAVEANRVTARANVEAKSSSGSVRMNYIEGQFTLQSTSGSVRVQDGRGAGSLQSSSGTVELHLQEVWGDLRLTSTSGSAKLNVPSDLSFTFYGHSNSGNVRTGFDEWLSYNSKGNEANGTVGSDPVGHIEMKASSGNVRLNA